MYTLIRIGYQPGGAFVQSAHGHVPAASSTRHRVSLSAGIFADDLISAVEKPSGTRITPKRNTTLIVINEHPNDDGVYLVYCPLHRKLALYDDAQNVILTYYDDEEWQCRLQSLTVGDFLAAKIIIA
jgi:hypothetical protein